MKHILISAVEVTDFSDHECDDCIIKLDGEEVCFGFTPEFQRESLFHLSKVEGLEGENALLVKTIEGEEGKEGEDRKKGYKDVIRDNSLIRDQMERIILKLTSELAEFNPKEKSGFFKKLLNLA